MRVKTFEAATMKEALAMIKADMGEDASIVSNKTKKRTLANGAKETYIEVTAAVDEESQPEPSMPIKSDGVYALRQPLIPAANKRHAPSHSHSHTQAKPPAHIPAQAQQPEPAKAHHEPQQPAWIHAKPAPKPAAQPPPSAPDVDLQPIRRELLEIRGAMEALKEQDARNTSILSELDQLKSMLSRIQKHGLPGLSHQLPPALLGLYGDLVANDVDPMTAVRLCEYTQRALSDQGGEENVDPDKVRLFMRRVISNFIPVAAPIQLDPNKVQVAALIGPTGVGKTTTIAKLAAFAKINLKQKVALLTMDTYHMGSADLLQQHAQALEVPIHVIITAEDLKNALNFYQDRSLVLIDTPGHQQHETARLDQLGAFLQTLPQVEAHLVLPATAKPRDLAEIAKRFERLRPDRLIFTKLDETCTYGPILSTLVRVKRPISYLGTGQEIPQDIELATSKRIADLILPPAQVHQ